jgi:hypothetical protein
MKSRRKPQQVATPAPPKSALLAESLVIGRLAFQPRAERSRWHPFHGRPRARSSGHFSAVHREAALIADDLRLITIFTCGRCFSAEFGSCATEAALRAYQVPCSGVKEATSTDTRRLRSPSRQPKQHSGFTSATTHSGDREPERVFLGLRPVAVSTRPSSVRQMLCGGLASATSQSLSTAWTMATSAGASSLPDRFPIRLRHPALHRPVVGYVRQFDTECVGFSSDLGCLATSDASQTLDQASPFRASAADRCYQIVAQARARCRSSPQAVGRGV